MTGKSLIAACGLVVVLSGCIARTCEAQDLGVGTDAMPDPNATLSVTLQITSDGDYKWKLDKVAQGLISSKMGVKQVKVTPGPHEITARSAEGKFSYIHDVNAVDGKRYAVKITMKQGQGAIPVSSPSPSVRSLLLKTPARSAPMVRTTSTANTTTPPATGYPVDPFAGNPNTFVAITPMVYPLGTSKRKTATSSGWQIVIIAVSARGTYYDVKLQVIMKGVGSAAATVELPEPQPGNLPSTFTTSAEELGSEAVVCYTGRAASQTAQRWTGTFTIKRASDSGLYGSGVAFVPAREPSLEPAGDSPCGGLKSVKAAPLPEVTADPAAADSKVDSAEADLSYTRGSQLYRAHRYSEARPLLIKACNAGASADACNAVGFMYQTNQGVPVDYQLAREYYLKSCNDDSSLSCANLGSLYRDGLGVAQDYPEAARLFDRACDAGIFEGCHAEANLYIGHLGVPQDYARALQLFKKACDGDLAAGCGDEGGSYLLGRGVPKDLPFAASLFSKACAMGSPSSCFNIGMAYRRGDGVTRDPAKSSEYFTKACSMGDRESCGLARQ